MNFFPLILFSVSSLFSSNDLSLKTPSEPLKEKEGYFFDLIDYKILSNDNAIFFKLEIHPDLKTPDTYSNVPSGEGNVGVVFSCKPDRENRMITGDGFSLQEVVVTVSATKGAKPEEVNFQIDRDYTYKNTDGTSSRKQSIKTKTTSSCGPIDINKPAQFLYVDGVCVGFCKEK